MKNTSLASPHKITPVVLDLIILFVLALAVFALAIRFDVIDNFVKWYQQVDAPAEIEEIITVPLVLSFAIGIFALRRWRESVREIAAHRRAEEQLQASDANFRLTFASNPLPMWVYDRGTLEFLEVNEAAVMHYDYSRAEFLRMRITDIRPLEDVPLLLVDVAQPRSALQFSNQWRHRRRQR